MRRSGRQGGRRRAAAGLALAAMLVVAPPSGSQDDAGSDASLHEPHDFEAGEAPAGPVSAPARPAPRPGAAGWGDFELLGERTAPGQRRDLLLRASESFAGDDVATRVVAMRGQRPGLTLCLTAAVHGDELNGVEIVRRVLERVEPETMAGTLVAVPIVNVHGFRRNSRYLPDRRDLNRFFPGNLRGSSASRIAGALFESVIRRCDALVDLHTGSFHRSNIPQVRGDLRNAAVAHLANGFGASVVVHSLGHERTLRRSATEAGVPAITYEGGEPMRFQTDEIERGVMGLARLLRFLGMVDGTPTMSGDQHFYYESHWVRVDDGGILLNAVDLGQHIHEDELLGTITDPVTNERTPLRSPFGGRVIGMALPQVVIPGFAAFHIGVEGTHPLEEAEAPDLLDWRHSEDVGGDALEAEEHPE